MISQNFLHLISPLRNVSARRMITSLVCGGLYLALASAPILAASEGYEEQEGEHVRVTRHSDGARTIFKRYPSQRKLIKRSYDNQGVLQLITQYVDSPSGQPLSCLIYNGQKQLLFKVRYGYDPKTGRLMQEIMSDAASNTDVRKFCYTYDSQGNRNAPVCYTLVSQEKIRELNQNAQKATALDSDPFARPPEKPASRR